MTNQEKIQYLRRYQAIERRVDRSLEERERWRARAEKITPTYTGMPGGGEVEDRMQQAVEKICEIEAQLDADIDLLIETKKEIVRAIRTVSEPRYREGTGTAVSGWGHLGTDRRGYALQLYTYLPITWQST